MGRVIAGRGSDQFMVRLPEGMRERIREAAEKIGRSMNAEIIDRLDRSFYEDTEDKFLLQLSMREFDKTLPPGLASGIQAIAERNGTTPQDEVLQALIEVFQGDLRGSLERAQQRERGAMDMLMAEHERYSLLTDRRIPEGLYGRIAKKARESERAVEEEIVQALEKAFPPPRPPAELREIADMIDDLLTKVGTPEDYDVMRALTVKLRADADEQEQGRVVAPAPPPDERKK